MELTFETTRKYIEPKLERGIRPSLDSLRRKIRITKVLPDFSDRGNPHTIVQLFEERERWYVWAQEATDSEIFARLEFLQSELSDDELGCKYSDCSFLPDSSYKQIVFIEDMEIALGIHPGCGPVTLKIPKEK